MWGMFYKFHENTQVINFIRQIVYFNLTLIQLRKNFIFILSVDKDIESNITYNQT